MQGTLPQPAVLSRSAAKVHGGTNPDQVSREYVAKITSPLSCSDDVAGV